jgi:dihydrofolate reductase
MGPKTYASLPEERRPLKGRLNIIITSNYEYKAPEGVLVARDPRQALELAGINNCIELFVIGGAMVYTSFLPLQETETLYITYVNSGIEGDTHFPHWNKSEWHQAWAEQEFRKKEGDSFPTMFAEYRRILKPLPENTQTNWRLPASENKILNDNIKT